MYELQGVASSTLQISAYYPLIVANYRTFRQYPHLVNRLQPGVQWQQC